MRVSKRKISIIEHSNSLAKKRLEWKEKNHFFHSQDEQYLSFLIPNNATVLELGCGVGDSLAKLKPAIGVGIDISDEMINIARESYPQYEFLIGDIEDENVIDNINLTFDYILLSDTIGYLEDCQKTLKTLHKLCKRETRIIISYYSYIWEPILKIGEFFNQKIPQNNLNYLTSEDIKNLLFLSGFDIVKEEWRQLIPIHFFGIGKFINRFFAPLPFIRRLCLRNYVVGRSETSKDTSLKSCSIIIPCRNEKGNIESAIKRTPTFCEKQEFIFIEGHSEDGTYDEIERVINAYPDFDIKVLKQDGIGKADAVYKGFDLATSEVLMILDADLTMPPEELSKFWDVISSGQAEYVNGSRLVYPMEDDAMRLLNYFANRFFSILFTWLLNQRYTDTLCGTKVLKKSDYSRLKENKDYFGDFDPFGDFDLIFGSSKLCLRMVEIPITYQARSYGNTQISRFHHGIQLLRMVIYGYRKLKVL